MQKTHILISEDNILFRANFKHYVFLELQGTT
jgi:hypothetical protein